VTVDLDVLVRSDFLLYLKKETEERNATIINLIVGENVGYRCFRAFLAIYVIFSQLYRIPFKSSIEGLGDWPTHVAHIKRGTIVAFHDFYNNFPELDKMIVKSLELRTTNEEDTQSSLSKSAVNKTSHTRRNMDSPLLKLVEQWLRQDFIELRQLKLEEKKKNLTQQDKVLLGEDLPRTRWHELSDNMKTYGDKYYNYWK
ncbi:12380_t:CDS:2, partial [Ambispora leptoticha]